MKQSPQNIAAGILSDPHYRGYNLKYRLRWSIGHWLSQRDWYTDTYFDIPIDEHVDFINTIERCIRTKWQEKGKETRQQTKRRRHRAAEAAKQLTLKL